MSDLRLPRPLPQQRAVLDSGARWKVLRCGRRWGKTRVGMLAALDGHGPRNTRNEPTLPGLLQGGDVIWVGSTRKQAGQIWIEDIKPRLDAAGVFQLNETDRTATLPGRGTLHLVEAGSVDAKVRGTGKRLKGVIIDEAAHFDLEYAIRNAIRPALMDNKGWAMFMSTTNAGTDGNAEQRMPSYFNIICEEIRAQDARRMGWEEFSGTAFDNPRIDPAEVRDLVNEYEPGAIALEQEVYAKLLKPGAGLALEQMDFEWHVAPWEPFRVPSHWYEWGAFDWGYNHPWFFGHFAADEDGNAYLVDSVTGRKQTPEEIALTVSQTLPWRRMRVIHAGHDCWHEKGRSIGEDTPTIAETFGKAGMHMTPANRDLVQGLDLMRRMVRWHGESMTDTQLPRLRIVNTPTNQTVFRQLAALQIDPKHPEKPLKRDAVDGKGGDDAADMVRYGLCARFLNAPTEDNRYEFRAFSPEGYASDMELLKVKNRFHNPPKPPKGPERPLDDVLGEMY